MEMEKDEITVIFKIKGRHMVKDLMRIAGIECRSVENQCKYLALAGVYQYMKERPGFVSAEELEAKRRRSKLERVRPEQTRPGPQNTQHKTLMSARVTPLPHSKPKASRAGPDRSIARADHIASGANGLRRVSAGDFILEEWDLGLIRTMVAGPNSSAFYDNTRAVVRAFGRAGLRTVDDLCKLTREEVAAIKGIGSKVRLEQIETYLGLLGLQLGTAYHWREVPAGTVISEGAA